MTAPTTNPTYGAWFESFLQSIGLGNISNAQRVTDEQALADIVHYEGLNTRNNPFNVVQKVPGSTTYNSVGVQSYSTPEMGLQATQQFFGPGRNHIWDPFVTALQSGSHAQIIASVDKAYQSWGSHGPSDYGTSVENQIITGTEGSGKLVPLPSVESTGQVISGAISDTFKGITSPLGAIESIWSELSSVTFWIRVGFVILGFAAVVIGLHALTNDNGSSKEIVPMPI